MIGISAWWKRGGSTRRGDLPPVTLIGNPFDSIGRSQHLRTIWRSLATAGVHAFIHDVFGVSPEPAVAREMGRHYANYVPSGFRIFHLNGDEIESRLSLMERRSCIAFEAGYNIVAPVWELPRYPVHWARHLDRFDEIWVPTAFVENAVRRAVSAPVIRMPNACEPHIAKPLERSHFYIPSSAFAILYFFDVRSFPARKNPWAAIEAFERLIQRRPAASAHLILKLNNSDHNPEVLARIRAAVYPFRERVTVLTATLTDNEVKNLVRCCDCFLSLHRSEGFGRGPAEAMFLGKPVVATGWSGNMEYMNADVSFPIAYTLVPVRSGEYLEPNDQVWAEPDVRHAANILIRLLDDPLLAREVGARAQAHMKREFADQVLGKVYRSRLEVLTRDPAHQSRINGRELSSREFARSP